MKDAACKRAISLVTAWYDDCGQDSSLTNDEIFSLIQIVADAIEKE